MQQPSQSTLGWELSMDIEQELCLSSGETLEIPERLYQIMRGEEIADPLALKTDDRDLETLHGLAEEYSPEGLSFVLQMVLRWWSDEQRRDECVLYICRYANIKAHLALETGDQETGCQLLVDSLELGNNAFLCIQPSVARELADQMIVQSEKLIGICSLFGSIQVLASRKAELLWALDMALTFWEPEFAPALRTIKREAEIILAHTGPLSPENVRSVHEAALLLKRDVHKQIGRRAGVHSDLLKNLTGSILEMFQQEILLTAHSAYTSDGLNAETIYYQARSLVEKLEKRLRTVIARKYQQQYKAGWLEHISARHRQMYERWQRYIHKDRSAFKLYNDYTPETLDYALIEDLRELIEAQWHLFREIFDFGYQERNKAVFSEKITQVISVRNALAHHRLPPENELLRTRVLCTDLLLAIDKSGEIVE